MFIRVPTPSSDADGNQQFVQIVPSHVSAVLHPSALTLDPSRAPTGPRLVGAEDEVPTCVILMQSGACLTVEGRRDDVAAGIANAAVQLAQRQREQEIAHMMQLQQRAQGSGLVVPGGYPTSLR